MSATGLLVIGAGPAAHAAAAAYRDAGGRGDVVMLAGEGRPPYQRPPLSKDLLRGESGLDALPLEAPSFYAERRIDVRPATAAALDPARRTATLADGGGEIAFDACVLATGAEPVRPDVDGAGLEGVQVLRTVADALALRERATPGARAVVVGSGFIGCEAAASLRARGCEVALLSDEPAPQAARLGDEVARRLATWLATDGIDARFGATLLSVAPGEDGALRVEADDGGTLAADLVLLAVGVRSRSDLARAAGLDLGEADEVRADSAMRTAAPGVLACGDCARAAHAVAGRHLHVEHWGDALAQGEVAGTTAAGGDAAWTTVPGFWSTIGARTLKYAAWGDGFDTAEVVDHGRGAFTAWYGAEGRTVGVLTHDRDDDYERGRERIAAGARLP